MLFRSVSQSRYHNTHTHTPHVHVHAHSSLERCQPGFYHFPFLTCASGSSFLTSHQHNPWIFLSDITATDITSTLAPLLSSSLFPPLPLPIFLIPSDVRQHAVSFIAVLPHVLPIPTASGEICDSDFSPQRRSKRKYLP